MSTLTNMETFRLATLLLLIAIMVQDSEQQMGGRYRIKFRVGVKEIGNYDQEYLHRWEDWSDIYLRVYMGRDKNNMLGQTITQPNVRLNHNFAKDFEIAYDGDRNQQMLIEVWDQEINYGDYSRDKDTHVGDTIIKMKELAQVGKHDYPIWLGHTEQQGKLVVYTRSVRDDIDDWI